MRKESSSSQNATTFTCLICGENKVFVSVGECNHRCICLYCTLKSRLHYNDKRCLLCLRHLETIFICDFNDKTHYENLLKKKDEFYEDDEIKQNGIYYTTVNEKEEASKLRRFNCPIRNCRYETFKNLNSLIEHLNKEHKRFYCNCCLKENKNFLSEMKIYNQKNLQDHIKYGEYEKNYMICPPHPNCPFDNSIFYNDEKLFQHMNSFHFICQLCKNKNNIIFYSELKNLLAHYKNSHYVCPYQECLADIYVVFAKEEELIGHLITKHKVKNANERLEKLVFNKRKNSGNNKDLIHETGEFNFTDYINELKKNSEEYNKKKDNIFINKNEQHFNDEGIEVIYKYKNNNYNYNNYRNKKEIGRGKKIKRGENRNYYYNRNYNNNHNNKFHRGNFNKFEDNNYHIKSNRTYNDYYYKNNIEDEESKNNVDDNKENSTKDDKKQFQKNYDFSFVINLYLKIIKEYITNKIKHENIKAKFVMLPKETTYQIIVMIEKLETYEKLIELTYLNNFGIDLDTHYELKKLFMSSETSADNFKKILKNLELKKLLLLYKYLNICEKKIDHLFYKLDFEQIDEDLYEDFLEREKKINKKLDKFEMDKKNRQAFLKAELKVIEKKNILKREDKKVTEINKEKDKEVKGTENQKEQNQTKTNIYKLLNNENLIDDHENNHKGKGKKKKGKANFVEFNIKDFNMDKSFQNKKYK